METEIRQLTLVAPLFYTPAAEPSPFSYGEGAGRVPAGGAVFCFGLDGDSCADFEPEGQKLLGSLLSGGEAAVRPGAEPGENLSALPPGNYLFAQKRELLKKEDIIRLAVEIQQEALWQRLKPGQRLYLRYLSEDGAFVTQLFRPYSSA